MRKEFMLAMLVYLLMLGGIFYREYDHARSTEHMVAMAKKIAYSAYFTGCMKSLDVFQVNEPGIKDYCIIQALDFADATIPSNDSN